MHHKAKFQLLLGVFSHILDHPPEHRVKAQIYLATICRVNADTKITEQVPVFCYLVHIPAQAGETMDQEYISISIFCRRMEVQQTRTVHGEAAPYIAGKTNNFKVMLPALERSATFKITWACLERTSYIIPSSSASVTVRP